MVSDKRKTSVQNAELNRQIDENLRRAYGEALSEEVPDRFNDLIAQLKAKDEGKANGS